jgi:predicted histone-like DNA-binding protein
LKVKAKEKLQKIGKYADTYRYVMMPELYSTLTQDKVIKEAALRSGVSQGMMQACWDAAGEVIKAWATEGHSVALPGLGTMRFGLRAKSCETVNEVKTSLIKSRRIIFTPDTDLKDELHNTSIQITCYNRNGEVVKRVTSSDPGTVEEPEGDDNGENENEGGNENQNQNGGNSGSGSVTPSAPKLTINRSGNGTSSVSANGNAVSSGSELAAGTEVSISVTPAEGQVPTATLNGSSVALTENDGVYTGTFQMPSGNATLAINSGGTSGDSGFDPN